MRDQSVPDVDEPIEAVSAAGPCVQSSSPEMVTTEIVASGQPVAMSPVFEMSNPRHSFLLPRNMSRRHRWTIRSGQEGRLRLGGGSRRRQSHLEGVAPRTSRGWSRSARRKSRRVHGLYLGVGDGCLGSLAMARGGDRKSVAAVRDSWTEEGVAGVGRVADAKRFEAGADRRYAYREAAVFVGLSSLEAFLLTRKLRLDLAATESGLPSSSSTLPVAAASSANSSAPDRRPGPLSTTESRR